MSAPLPSDFQASLSRVETLIQSLDAGADAATLAAARELVQTLLKLHAAGLARVLAVLGDAGAAGDALTGTLGADALVSSLLLLHGLHPTPLARRVQEAVDGVRSQLVLLGGSIELLTIADGVVHLRLASSAPGPAVAAMRRTIEEALLERAPDLAELKIEGPQTSPRPAAPLLPEPAGLVTIRLPPRAGRP